MNIEVRDVPERQRYEGTRGGDVVGWVDYRRGDDGAVLLTHAETVRPLRGQGIGEQVVRGVLDDLESRGERDVVPVCGFVRSVMGAR